MDYKQIPFDINVAKDIISGKVDGKICTRANYDVHIYEFNARCNYPIAGKIIGYNSDTIASWNKKGENTTGNLTNENNLVLLIKEEHKFKPFDKILVPTFSFVVGFKIWKCSFFSSYLGDFVIDMQNVTYLPEKILPFEGNEHLAGKPV